jgi:hypothetical protein
MTVFRFDCPDIQSESGGGSKPSYCRTREMISLCKRSPAAIMVDCRASGPL